MSTKSKTTSSIDPRSSALIYDNADRANNLADSFKPYTGQLTAGFNDNQNNAQGWLKDFAYQDVGAEPLNQSLFHAQGAANYQPMQVGAQQVEAGQLSNTDLSPYMNPYQSQVIDQTLNQYDRQNQIDLNNARGRAASAGAFGGSGSALLQSQTQEANSRNLGGILAGLNSQNFSQAQNAASTDIGRRFDASQLNQSANLQGQLANQNAGLQGNAQRLQASGVLSGLSDQQRAQRLQNLGVLSAVGDTQQQQQQSELDAQHNAYLEWLNTQLQGQSVANSGVGAAQGAGTISGTVKQSPGLTGILQGVGSAAQGIAAFSDAALKTDIQPIGHDHRGRAWYRYRYVWEPEGAINHGVMAQEVQKTDPHAVFLHPSGFLMVDYGALD